MTRLCAITINGKSFQARAGERVLDAAILGGVELPHDCRAGRCGTCLVHVKSGHVLGGAGPSPGMVHACQAHVVSDLDITCDEIPAVSYTGGVVAGMVELVRDVVEVTIAMEQPIMQMPGQYARVTFAGFPARNYSPTLALDGNDQPGTFKLQIKRFAAGRVSSRLGGDIGLGHRVAIEGPFGSAHFRPRQSNRLMLFSGGTGFAPVWAIADAALRENAARAIVVVSGAQSLDALYMAPALQRMSICPNVTLLPVVEQPQSAVSFVRQGRPADFAGIIGQADIVHAAGAPEMVAKLAASAVAAGAVFHADPFTASPRETMGWLTALSNRFAAQSRKPTDSISPTAAAPALVRGARW